jgi:KH domain
VVLSKHTQAQLKAPTPEGITDTVLVPLKYHHVISQQGNFFRTLRSFGVQVDQSAQPQQSAVPSRPTDTSARIDDAESVPDVQWDVTPNYQNAEEGVSTWTLKARDQAGLGRAHKLVKEAMDHAERMSHVGFLTLSDRSVFPRIVGSKGANVARLRSETGADITVSRENNTIVIIGK